MSAVVVVGQTDMEKGERERERERVPLGQRSSRILSHNKRKEGYCNEHLILHTIS